MLNNEIRIFHAVMKYFVHEFGYDRVESYWPVGQHSDRTVPNPILSHKCDCKKTLSRVCQLTSHMSQVETKWSPFVWIPVAVACFFAVIFTSIILEKERKKRKSESILFTTKYVKLYSFWCLICGPISSVSLLLSFFNGFCHLFWYICVAVSMIQVVFLGFYQLSRLYYCFSQNQVYSNKGYPNSCFSLCISLVFFWFYLVGFIQYTHTLSQFLLIVV